MSLGKRKNMSDNKLLVLRLKHKTVNPETKKEEALMPNLFEISEKIDGKWVARPEMESNVGGNLTKVELATDEYEGTEYKLVKLYIEDGEAKETYLVDLRFTHLGRSLFNSLMSLKTFENIEISNYSTVSKKNGKTYANISLWQNDELVKGKIAYDDLPKPERIEDKKGNLIKYDFSEVDDLLWNELVEFAKLVNKGSSTVKSKKTEAEASSDEELETPEAQVQDDDVPF